MKLAALLGAALLLAACGGIQSALSPFGTEAQTIRKVTIWMTAAAAIVTLAVLLLAFHAYRAPPGQVDHRRGMRIILWLGAIVPTSILTLLLVTSLPTMRSIASSDDDLQIAVEGEQFWWRVRYQPPRSDAIETANEIRIPVGRTVAFELTSADVIHSFWIPGLAGKLDMIPGRTNRLVVRATRPGVYRGACAEFCGLSHAHMAFDVIAMQPEAFDRWLVDLANAAGPSTNVGRELFDNYGCAGCHAVRGHFPGSTIGPDLTHFGSRRSVAASTLPMTPHALERFVRQPAASKPGVRMPSFESMPTQDAAQIASYLMELR